MVHAYVWRQSNVKAETTADVASRYSKANRQDDDQAPGRVQIAVVAETDPSPKQNLTILFDWPG